MKAPYYFPPVPALVTMSGFSSCAKIKVEPIEINIRVTVQKELDDFFGDLDQREKTIAN